MQNLNGTGQGCCLIFFHAAAVKCKLSNWNIVWRESDKMAE
jgi:hypothetical protein